MKYTSLVNPFHGCGDVRTGKLVPPANTWHPIKGLAGNTTPAAVLPFGKYSCLTYDGAYPSGYGVNKPNSGGTIDKMYDRKHFIGLSHFHQSGVGDIRVFYNYALTVPFYGDIPNLVPRPILSEHAEPGYYAVDVEEMRAETTISRTTVCHRYHFDKKDGRLFIHFARNGLGDEKRRGKASGTVRILSTSRVCAEMLLSGVKLFFCAEILGGKTDGIWFRGKREENALTVSEPTDEPFGCLFNVERECELRLAVSAVSSEHAESLLASEHRSFDEIRRAASAEWEAALSRIEIETEDDREAGIFYSNLYHTLIKPCDFSDEAFLFRDCKGKFVTDIATLWDIYKTQLPLLFTLYPDISEKILATLMRFGEESGYFPHCLMLSSNTDIEAKQARMLAEYAICDGFWRGVKADYEKLLSLSIRDAARFSDFYTGTCTNTSHILDMAEALHALSHVARKLGRNDLADRFAVQGERFPEAFDHNDGMMRADSSYYEGNRYNYSFRPTHDTTARIEIAGKEATEAMAMRFFGFTDAADKTCRFEGFNNETDMESPWFLHFLGRRDLMYRVIRTGLDGMFTEGEGGIPGNADSGGLTACYLWNAIGLFPVAGLDKMVVGLPRYRKVTLHLPSGRDFTILNPTLCEPSGAALDGVSLPDFSFSASRMMQGGTLTIQE